MIDCTIIILRSDKILIDKSSELSALRSEVSDLKAMKSVMKEIIMNQNKQITDIHKSLFKNSIKSKDAFKDEITKALKNRIIVEILRK